MVLNAEHVAVLSEGRVCLHALGGQGESHMFPERPVT